MLTEYSSSDPLCFLETHYLSQCGCMCIADCVHVSVCVYDECIQQ